MIKVAVLDDYQNIFKEFIDIEKYQNKYSFKIFTNPFQSEDEAISDANDTEYGLAGYVQGEPEHAREVAGKIRAGQVIINGGARGTGAPFGGYKASGNGREHGIQGLEESLETKAIIAP